MNIDGIKKIITSKKPTKLTGLIFISAGLIFLLTPDQKIFYLSIIILLLLIYLKYSSIILRKKSRLIANYVFLGAIILFTLQQYADWPTIAFLKFFFQWLKIQQNHLLIISLLSGGLTIYLYSQRQTMPRIIKNNSQKTITIKSKPMICPRFIANKIFLLSNIINWLRNCNRLNTWLIILIISAGFLLRIYHLGSFNLLVEEQFHYAPAANLILTGQPTIFYTAQEYFGYINYYRTFLYTAITAGIFKIFGVNEFNLRILAVLLSTLTSVVIYLLTKEIFNKKLALLSTALFSFSAWAIWYDRWARHYVFDGLLLILSLYFSYLAFYKYKKNKYLYLTLIPLLLIPWVETGNYLYILINGILLFFILSIKEIWGLIKNKHVYIIILIALINFVVYNKLTADYYITPPAIVATTASITDNLLALPLSFLKNIWPLKFDNYFIKLIWGFYPLLIIYGTFSLFFLLINWRKKKYYFFFSFPLILLILSFYDPGRTWQTGQIWLWEPRHFSMLIPLYLSFIAIGLYLLIKSCEKKWMKIALILLTFFNIFSLKQYQINYGEDISKTPYLMMTAENFYSNIKEPITYIKNRFNVQTDTLIFDPMEVMYRAYWDKNPDQRIGWDIDDQRNLALSNIHNAITDNPQQLQNYILTNLQQNKRIWLIEASYNGINFHSRVRKGKIAVFLNKNQQCKVYGRAFTNVYLFNSSCFR